MRVATKRFTANVCEDSFNDGGSVGFSVRRVQCGQIAVDLAEVSDISVTTGITVTMSMLSLWT